MIIELSTGKKFIIKINYQTNYCTETKRDEFNRKIIISWKERDTIVTISEWKEKMPSSKVKFVGIAHCSYKDKFCKKVGKRVAYVKALNEMVKINFITNDELIELVDFDLNRWNYNTKE